MIHRVLRKTILSSTSLLMMTRFGHHANSLEASGYTSSFALCNGIHRVEKDGAVALRILPDPLVHQSQSSYYYFIYIPLRWAKSDLQRQLDCPLK